LIVSGAGIEGFVPLKDFELGKIEIYKSSIGIQ
jgi:hypothetical protein